MITRLIGLDDAEKLSHYYAENQLHFKPWMPQRDYGYNSLQAWRDRIQGMIAAQSQGASMHFISLGDDGRQVLAQCNLSQIFYGPFCACYMGYSVSHSMQGSGVMYKTCLHVIEHAFCELHLHRIMANYMPHNNRSAKLLVRLGFVKEGLAKNYLKINGRWENHILTSLTNPNMG